ncbi:hypothetical protein LEMLEM_LOCUS16030, partial [Lemmus lemmus]
APCSPAWNLILGSTEDLLFYDFWRKERTPQHEHHLHLREEVEHSSLSLPQDITVNWSPWQPENYTSCNHPKNVCSSRCTSSDAVRNEGQLYFQVYTVVSCAPWQAPHLSCWLRSCIAGEEKHRAPPREMLPRLLCSKRTYIRCYEDCDAALLTFPSSRTMNQ